MSKNGASSKKSLCRLRAQPKLNLLDCPDEVLLNILFKLGLTETLNPSSLRTVSSAFSLALTCTRLYSMVCNHITVLNACLTPWRPPPMYHPTSSSEHLAWCMRNFPNLKTVELPAERAFLAGKYCGDSNIEVLKASADFSPSLPTTLTDLKVSYPGKNVMSYLAALHQPVLDPPHPALESVTLAAMPITFLDQFKTFYKHSVAQLKFLYVSFAFARNDQAREEENKLVCELMKDICSTLQTFAPNLVFLTFAVTTECRSDTDWDRVNIGVFNQYMQEASPDKQFGNSLQGLFLFTDISFFDSWSTAVRPAITPLGCVHIEAGFDALFFQSPMLRIPPTITQHRLRTNLTLSDVEALRDYCFRGKLQTLFVTDRAVVDRFVHGRPEYRDLVIRYASAPDSISQIDFEFVFGERASRMALWDVEDAVDINLVVLAPHEESPHEDAYSFIVDIIDATKGTQDFTVSFELVEYAPQNEEKLGKLVMNLQALTDLHLQIPRDIKDKPLVDVTEKFLEGIPVLLGCLEENCSNLKSVGTKMLGDMTWKENANVNVLFENAFEAIKMFEGRRPSVDIESLKAMLVYWATHLPGNIGDVYVLDGTQFKPGSGLL